MTEAIKDDLVRYEIAHEALSESALLPEERLWRSVICNALDDTHINYSDRKSSIAKLKAHNWIISNCQDFQNVCYWAELDPEVVLSHYKNLVKRRVIKFYDKQILWYQYDLFYKTLEKTQDEQEKKKLRRKVKKMREFICDNPSILLSTIFLSVLS
tara:strand:- start:11288 stop:11755 length:468 start_codon:yes stop_codon:yes gene_type:complete